MKQTPARLEIKTEQPRVLIDQTQCFAEAGRKSLFELSLENTAISRQRILEAIGRLAQDGDLLMRIENGFDAIPTIAEQNAWPEIDYNLGLIPQSRPKIDVMGSLEINFIPGKVEINVQPQKPEIKYTPGAVEIYLAQRASISIRYLGEKIDYQA